MNNYKKNCRSKKLKQIIISDLSYNKHKYIAKTFKNETLELTKQEVADLISQNKLQNKRAVLISEKYDIKTDFKKLIFQIKHRRNYYSNGISIDIDFIKKILLNQKQDDWVLFRNIDFDGWNLYLEEKKA